MKKDAKGGAVAKSGRFLPYVLLSPLVLFIGVLGLYPTIITTVEAFFTVNPVDPPTRFAGLAISVSCSTTHSFAKAQSTPCLYRGRRWPIDLIGLVIAMALQRRTCWPDPDRPSRTALGASRCGRVRDLGLDLRPHFRGAK